MTAKKYFKLEISPYHPGYSLIKFDVESWEENSYTVGSYAILPARFLNLSYADYLRFCRDILGATIIGKGSRYPIPYFKREEEAAQLVRLLNGRANYLKSILENPDYDEQKKFVDNYKEKFTKDGTGVE